MSVTNLLAYRRGDSQSAEIVASLASLVSNLRQILDSHRPILTGECQRLVCALCLGHTEDAMVASVVNFYMAAVFDYQSSWKNGVPKVILYANGAGCSEISGPPI